MNEFAKNLINLAKTEFPLSGVVDLSLVQNDYQKHFKRYKEWIDHNLHGEMTYLERGLERREEVLRVFPEAKSVFCVGIPYAPWKKESVSPESVEYSSYLNSEDYHETVKRRLDGFFEKIKKETPELRWKTCVDTSAVLERSWAYFCGIGWIGKNTMLIHPQYGSYFYIGVVLLNQESNQSPQPLANFCGHCTECLDLCPTQAISIENGVHSDRCISYLTLEYRGSFEKIEAASQIENRVAGCDLCQEVCPFNRKVIRDHSVLRNHSISSLQKRDLQDLLRETDPEYLERVKTSAMKRIKPAQFKRNLDQIVKNKASQDKV